VKIDRLGAIRQHLYANGPTAIADLCEAVGASIATVRRDLLTLEKDGLIERVHGGARLAQGAGTELAFGQRENANIGAKRAIADAAFGLIQPNTAIFLDAGTTVLQLARRLRLDPIPLTAVTNGLPVAQELIGVPGLRVIVVGGELRHDNSSLVGPHAEAQLDRMYFDQLFMGAGAVGEDLNIYTGDLAEASLNARMLARSRQRIILADTSKFGRSATYLVAAMANVTHLISDAALPSRWTQQIENAGVVTISAKPSPEPRP
jgi:DeoR/GlpR family transcriptional regulator of sugar metabolism